ncbi:MAG: transcription termination factor NusA [Mycoplasmataceae bacterium]|nr:transcription termination factor NusA [Mycoplasmataceae bacterium]
MNEKIKQFFGAVMQIAEQNLLTKDETTEIIKNAIFKIFHNKFDPDAELELIMDEEKGIFEFTNKTKLVIADKEFNHEYSAIEVSLSAAKEVNPEIKEGDNFTEKVDFFSDKRVASQVRQLITQAVREKKKEAVYAKHKSLKGEMVSATVTSSTKSYAILELKDGTTAFMPSNLRNLNIPLSIGEKTIVYVEDVLKESKDSQIVVSNGSPTMVRRVLESEVPEIAEGIVEVINISRMAGTRSKVLVKSNNENADAVGAIIGTGGSRIKTIVEKLEGEKLDIIPFSEDVNMQIANALSPAKVVSVNDKLDAEGKIIENHKIVITPNKHQTLAIGKKGSNAKLAVELIKHRLDIISIDQANEKGIAILYNGTIKDEGELAMVEAGERIQRAPRRVAQSRNAPFMGDFDTDITSFAEKMEGESEGFNDVFEVKDDLFTEDELRKMEQNFNPVTELEGFDENSFNEDDINFDELEDAFEGL